MVAEPTQPGPAKFERAHRAPEFLLVLFSSPVGAEAALEPQFVMTADEAEYAEVVAVRQGLHAGNDGRR